MKSLKIIYAIVLLFTVTTFSIAQNQKENKSYQKEVKKLKEKGYEYIADPQKCFEDSACGVCIYSKRVVLKKNMKSITYNLPGTNENLVINVCRKVYIQYIPTDRKNILLRKMMRKNKGFRKMVNNMMGRDENNLKIVEYNH